MIAVEFVCLGNICRSPLAEGVFRSLAAQAGLGMHFEIASCGTGGWHVGEPPDPRTIAVARRHGIDISAQRARQFEASHLDRYHEVLAMDSSNLATIRRHDTPGPTTRRARIGLMLGEARWLGVQDVPDPYGGGPEEFEEVYQLLSVSCAALLARLRGIVHPGG